jgi:hypothetical protein
MAMGAVRGQESTLQVAMVCLGEEADGYEGDGLDPLLDRARFACPELASVGADSGFAAERLWRRVERRGLVAYIPHRSRRCCARTASPQATPSGRPWPPVRAVRASAASGRTSSGWRTPRASSANSRTNTGSTASARAERRSSTSSSCSAVPPSTAKRLADHVPEAASCVAAGPGSRCARPPNHDARRLCGLGSRCPRRGRQRTRCPANQLELHGLPQLIRAAARSGSWTGP